MADRQRCRYQPEYVLRKIAAARNSRVSLIDKQHPPASTLAGVESLFRPDVQVEIDAEAVIP